MTPGHTGQQGLPLPQAEPRRRAPVHAPTLEELLAPARKQRLRVPLKAGELVSSAALKEGVIMRQHRAQQRLCIAPILMWKGHVAVPHQGDVTRRV